MADFAAFCSLLHLYCLGAILTCEALIAVKFGVAVEHIFLDDGDDLAILQAHLGVILPVYPAIGAVLVTVDGEIAVVDGPTYRIAPSERAPGPVGPPAPHSALRFKLAPSAIAG